MTSAAIDEYLAALPDDQRAALDSLRQTIRELAPDATECLSYGIPGFQVEGRTIAGFAAFKNHLSYFPHSGSVLTALAGDLSGYPVSKGTLRFTVDRPLPRDLVAKLLAARRAELQ